MKKRRPFWTSDIVEEAISILNNNSNNLRDFGKLINEAWKIKKSLTSVISTNKIDKVYDTAIAAGALGGKLLGAGGGGFMLFLSRQKISHV